jgi:transposase InsO family protein
MQYIHDQGGTFIGTDFTRIIEEDNGIPLVPTSTVKNRQANAICERIHQTIENTLRTMPLDSVSATTMFASRVLPYRSLMDNTPGALAFHRDMLLAIPLIADLITICNSRQRILNERLRVANLHHLNHDYQIGERVLFKVFAPKKLDARWHDPYQILTVHVNGTLTIRLNAHAVERVNVRRLKPYRS